MINFFLEPEGANTWPPVAYLKVKEYSIGEDEASDSLAVYVCVGLNGTLEQPVSVQLQTEPGTATGTVHVYSYSLLLFMDVFILDL